MQRRVRTVWGRDRDERGVVAVVMALVICFLFIPLAAYAVDIGVQRVARRDVQAVADMVALDLARELDGRTYSQLHGNLQHLADKSAARNAGGVGEAPTVVPELGKVDEDDYDPTDPDAYFTPITSDAGGVPNAVRVQARGAVDFVLQSGGGGVNRTAVATAEASACFDVGSFALSLNSSNSPLLDSLIGDALNLSAISYTGLANANVTLLGLATELGVGSVDGLLDLENLSLGDLYLASAEALQKAGGETADIALLNQLATANIGALPHIAFGDIFDLESGNDAALSGSVNLLDLVATSAFLANGTNALAVPNLSVGIPGITGVTASLKVIEGPKRGCRLNQEIRTSQIDLTLHVTVINLNILLLAATTTVDITVNVAEAKAKLTNVICGNPEGIDVAVNSALASVALGLNVDLKLLGLSIAKVTAAVGTTTPAGSTTVQFRNPPDSYSTPKSVGSNAVIPTLALNDLTITLFGVLPLGVSSSGLLSGVLNSIVTPIVNPLIANVNTLLLNPLMELLGLKLGGADIYAVPPLTCANPVLAG